MDDEVQPKTESFTLSRLRRERLNLYADGSRMGSYPRDSVRIYGHLTTGMEMPSWKVAAVVPVEAFEVKTEEMGYGATPMLELSRDEARQLYEELGRALGYQSAAIAEQVIRAKDAHIADLRQVALGEAKR